MIAVLGLSRFSSISQTTRSLAAKIRSSIFSVSLQKALVASIRASSKRFLADPYFVQDLIFIFSTARVSSKTSFKIADATSLDIVDDSPWSSSLSASIDQDRHSVAQRLLSENCNSSADPYEREHRVSS